MIRHLSYKTTYINMSVLSVAYFKVRLCHFLDQILTVKVEIFKMRCYMTLYVKGLLSCQPSKSGQNLNLDHWISIHKTILFSWRLVFWDFDLWQFSNPLAQKLYWRACRARAPTQRLNQLAFRPPRVKSGRHFIFCTRQACNSSQINLLH